MNVEHVVGNVTYRIQTRFAIGTLPPGSTATAARKGQGATLTPVFGIDGHELEILGMTDQEAIARTRDYLDRLPTLISLKLAR